MGQDRPGQVSPGAGKTVEGNLETLFALQHPRRRRRRRRGDQPTETTNIGRVRDVKIRISQLQVFCIAGCLGYILERFCNIPDSTSGRRVQGRLTASDS